MRMSARRSSSGFTIIELLLVIVLVIILAALVIFTYSGVRSKNRNAERRAAIDTLQAQLETFYAVNSKYPTLSELNQSTWRSQNIKNLPANGLRDPSWNKSLTGCTNAQHTPVAAAQPTEHCYSYEMRASDGSACDNTNVTCGRYTLTAILEGGDTYVKKSLN